MYLPKSFEVTDPDAIDEHIRRHPFATLFAFDGAECQAHHLPLIVHHLAGNKVLEGHVARPNSFARSLPCRVLAVFPGPHAYVSARWYEAPGTVPTWNYTAVHIHGQAQSVDDPNDVLAMLARLATHLEPTDDGWRPDSTHPATSTLIQQIVAFRISIERVEAKSKLSQNHASERQRRVIDHLERQHDTDSQAIARMMRMNLEGSVDSTGRGSQPSQGGSTTVR